MPLNLRLVANWVVWKIEVRDGKPTKVPIDPKTGRMARSNDASTWASYDEALSYYERHSPDVEGVGFQFSNSEFTGIDLDHCRDPETGDVEPWASEIITAVYSYTEVSPSGTGIHIIVRGKLPVGVRRKGKIEMYDSGRYFTMTGNRLPGMPRQPRERSMHDVWKRYLCDEPEKTEADPDTEGLTPEDRELIKKVKTGANGHKFDCLWRGDFSGYPSQSEADMALCQILSFWAQKNAFNVDRLFRHSGLYREKWDERHYGDGRTYGQVTVQKAIEQTQEVYSGDSETGSTRVNEEWPDPIPFDDHSCLPDFPIDAILPDIGRRMVEKVSEVMQVDPALTALFYLGTLSACCAGKAIVDLGTHTEPLNLYLCPVYASGNRKSPTENHIARPLRKYCWRR
jgi:primase-polymerase (primpol)-like protein